MLWNDYVQIPRSSISGTELTLQAWVNPANITTNTYYNILRRGHPGIPAGSLLAFHNNGTRLSFGVNTSTGYTELDVPISAASFVGTWHHVAGVYDGATMKLYVDCDLVGIRNKTGTIQVNPNAGIHRISFGPNNELFDGAIDDVKIWSVARNAVDLLAPITGNEPGLFAWYSFNQGVAGGNNAGLNTLNDLSINGNAGQLMNFALNGACSNWVVGAPPFSCTILPLGSVSFEGKDVAGGNLLEWMTAEGFDGQYFWLERSADGSLFEVIHGEVGLVDEQAYRYLDRAPFAGENFYRLKVVDGNGQVYVTETVAVHSEGANEMAIHPNPTRGTVNLRMQRALQDGRIRWWNGLGQVVREETGLNGSAFAFDLGGLGSGVYVVEVLEGGGVSWARVVVE